MKLSIRIFHNAGNPATDDPYARVCNDALLNFTALERLEFNIDILGDRTLYPDDLALRQWRRLPEMLAQPDLFPKLQQLSVRICIRTAGPIRPVVGSSGDWLQEEHLKEINRRNVAVDKMSEDLTKLVDIPYFRPLVTFRPSLELSFMIETVMA